MEYPHTLITDTLAWSPKPGTDFIVRPHWIVEDHQVKFVGVDVRAFRMKPLRPVGGGDYALLTSTDLKKLKLAEIIDASRSHLTSEFDRRLYGA